MESWRGRTGCVEASEAMSRGASMFLDRCKGNTVSLTTASLHRAYDLTYSLATYSLKHVFPNGEGSTSSRRELRTSPRPSFGARHSARGVSSRWTCSGQATFRSLRGVKRPYRRRRAVKYRGGGRIRRRVFCKVPNRATASRRKEPGAVLCGGDVP